MRNVRTMKKLQCEERTMMKLNKKLSLLFIVILTTIGLAGIGAGAEVQKISASDASANAHFGTSIDQDQYSTIIIGSPSTQYHPKGEAYLVKYDGTKWVEWEIFTSGSNEIDTFGSPVSMDKRYDDYRTIAVGASTDGGKGKNSGAVYVYHLEDGQWKSQKLQASDGAEGDLFGSSIYVSPDGFYILVGAPSMQGYGSGKAYLFTQEHFDPNNYVERRIYNAQPGDKSFGWAVRHLPSFRSTDFKTTNGAGQVVIGSIGGNEGKGQVRIFDELGNLLHTLTASDASQGDQFGNSIDNVGNDNLVIGAPGKDNSKGEAYMFNYDVDSNKWLETQTLTAPERNIKDRFGYSVSIGKNITIGAPSIDSISPNSNPGKVYVFEYDGASKKYNQFQTYTAFTPEKGDYFGVSISSDANNISIGAIGVQDKGEPGAVYTGAFVDWNKPNYIEMPKPRCLDSWYDPECLVTKLPFWKWR